MLYYDGSKPVTYTPIFDAAYFAKGTNADVIVRDANGAPVKDANGNYVTRKGELRDLLVPFASDRADLIAQAVVNQREFVEQLNDWVGNIHRAFLELERNKPTGNTSNKSPKTNSQGYDFDPDFTISAQTATTLYRMRDSDGVRYLTKFFGIDSSELANYVIGNPGDATTTFDNFPGFTNSVSIKKMADGQAWSTFDNAFQSALDSYTQKAQLEQTTLQGLVSRHNNAVETMADLQSKFAGTIDKLVANLRPAR